MYDFASAPLALERAPFDEAAIIVADYQMEPVDGIRFADTVHLMYPRIAIIIVSAYTTADLERHVARRDWVRLCRKPFDYDGLHDMVDAGSMHT